MVQIHATRVLRGQGTGEPGEDKACLVRQEGTSLYLLIYR